MSAPNSLRYRLYAFLLLLGWVPVSVAEEAPARAVHEIVAHRGSRADRPENTLASARRAIEAGATAVEIDVRMTKDGALVLSHDPTVDRVTNGTGRIKDKTLDEVEKLDAGEKFDPKFKGERIPTLEQELTVCRGKVDALLDLKENGDEYDRKVIETVKTSGDPHRTIIGVRTVEQAKKFRSQLPEARQLGLIEDQKDVDAFRAAGVEMIRLWPKWLPDEKLVARVRQDGGKLHLNGKTGAADEVLKLLEYRPDSISSDDPARLKATLATLGR
ncbi:MAG TPA: glycerophosphodiester phosphodiesterase family protein [Candidatus Limnocylindrales bacterium]|nr:glycerophosphodiester phosphodiesterase family protein [Candidatus Limnocylindrales bacterium]